MAGKSNPRLSFWYTKGTRKSADSAMETEVSTQQPAPPAPAAGSAAPAPRQGLFKRHPVLTFLAGACIALILGLWLCFWVILKVGVSKTSDTRYDVTLKGSAYQAILSEPQYVFPYFSVAENEFGNKIILIRSDIPEAMRDFLIARALTISILVRLKASLCGRPCLISRGLSAARLASAGLPSQK